MQTKSPAMLAISGVLHAVALFGGGALLCASLGWKLGLGITLVAWFCKAGD
jgi:hypothetical protein